MVSLFDELIKEGLITSEQLADARVKQVGAKKPIHELLVEMGFVSEKISLNYSLVFIIFLSPISNSKP